MSDQKMTPWLGPISEETYTALEKEDFGETPAEIEVDERDCKLPQLDNFDVEYVRCPSCSGERFRRVNGDAEWCEQCEFRITGREWRQVYRDWVGHKARAYRETRAAERKRREGL